jgi:voltage-gated potassium channel Kch
MAHPLSNLLRGIKVAFRDTGVRWLLAFTFTLIAAAALFYSLVEGWPYLDAIYFSVMTLATVGYGDLAPVTTLGRLFTIVYVLIGLGIFVSAATAIAQAILAEAARDRKPHDRDNG